MRNNNRQVKHPNQAPIVLRLFALSLRLDAPLGSSVLASMLPLKRLRSLSRTEKAISNLKFGVCIIDI